MPEIKIPNFVVGTYSDNHNNGDNEALQKIQKELEIVSAKLNMVLNALYSLAEDNKKLREEIRENKNHNHSSRPVYYR
jgi:peptidoglycan hydrolase CwlO-like protein